MLFGLPLSGCVRPQPSISTVSLNSITFRFKLSFMLDRLPITNLLRNILYRYFRLSNDIEHDEIALLETGNWRLNS